MAKTERTTWQKAVVEKKNALRALYFADLGQGKSKDVKVVGKARHEIARLLTAASLENNKAKK
ncbi:MAG: hypothetical protein AAB364_00940 [Patescibacteria group bacterium]